MSGEPTAEEEFRRLVAERAVDRECAARALSSLTTRMQDPFGLKARIQGAPIASAGIAAAAGALVGLVLSPKRRTTVEAAASVQASATASGGSGWGSMLRDVALRAATPLLAEFLQEKLSAKFRGNGASERCAEGRSGSGTVPPSA